MAEQGMLGASVQSGAKLGTGALLTRPYDANLYPYEQEQNLLWHQCYFMSSGDFIQFFMHFDQAQMLIPSIALAPFEIEAITIHTQPLGRMQS